MKKAGIAFFTEQGGRLAHRIADGLAPEYEILWYEKGLKGWCAACFAEAELIIFIGACGIAVRTIAPLLKSKTEDPAVLVLDEAGQYVISLLSGHIGGANAYAQKIAGLTGATPVITTASDVRGKIAVDVFAKNNHLTISSMKAAKCVEAAILRGEPVEVYCSGTVQGAVPPELTLIQGSRTEKWSPKKAEPTGNEGGDIPAGCRIWISGRTCPWLQSAEKDMHDTLVLTPRVVTIGIGCRKGKPADAVSEALRRVLAEEQIPKEALVGIASIDLKKDEEGILDTARRMGLSFTTYTSEQLLAVRGDFTPSEFVKRTTGVDNVCERAALLLAGDGGTMIRKKEAGNGVTVALAIQKWGIQF